MYYQWINELVLWEKWIKSHTRVRTRIRITPNEVSSESSPTKLMISEPWVDYATLWILKRFYWVWKVRLAAIELSKMLEQDNHIMPHKRIWNVLERLGSPITSPLPQLGKKILKLKTVNKMHIETCELNIRDTKKIFSYAQSKWVFYNREVTNNLDIAFSISEGEKNFLRGKFKYWTKVNNTISEASGYKT